MQSKKQIKTLHALASNAEREASLAVSQRRGVLEAEEQRLAQLHAYLDDYSRDDASTSGLFIDTIRTRRAFVTKIRGGIEQQERLIAGLRRQLELDLQRWHDTRTRALGLERFAERLQDEEDLRQDRREQAKLDEVGRNMHHRRAAG